MDTLWITMDTSIRSDVLSDFQPGYPAGFQLCETVACQRKSCEGGPCACAACARPRILTINETGISLALLAARGRRAPGWTDVGAVLLSL